MAVVTYPRGRIRNPSGIGLRRGKLTDKYGRTLRVDWKAYDRCRKNKVHQHPALYAVRS